MNVNGAFKGGWTVYSVKVDSVRTLLMLTQLRFLFKRYKLCSTTNKEEKKKGPTVILLQIVMVSPRTDLVENNFIMTPSSEAMSAS